MAGEKVTWTIRHDAVLVTTKEKARGKPIIVNHDVQDLVFGLTDFLGPRIDRLRLLDEMQDDDGGGPFGGIGEKPKLIEPADLATLIQENVAVGTWEDEGISIDAGEGYILIIHTPEVQEQVRQFLEDLRRFSSSLVTIESKFMTVGVELDPGDRRRLPRPRQPELAVQDSTTSPTASRTWPRRGLDNGGTGTSASNAAGPRRRASSTTTARTATSGPHARTSSSNAARQRALDDRRPDRSSSPSSTTSRLSAILRAVEKSSNFQLINDQVLSVHNTQRAYVHGRSTSAPTSRTSTSKSRSSRPSPTRRSTCSTRASCSTCGRRSTTTAST